MLETELEDIKETLNKTIDICNKRLSELKEPELLDVWYKREIDEQTTHFQSLKEKAEASLLSLSEVVKTFNQAVYR